METDMDTSIITTIITAKMGIIIMQQKTPTPIQSNITLRFGKHLKMAIRG
jgi:hypothetical protein